MKAKETTISGFWDMLSFYCDQSSSGAACGDALELMMQGTTPIYRCPRCGFSVPFYDVERAMKKISDTLVDAAKNDEDINLANMRWATENSKNGAKIRYRVLTHKNNKLQIGIAEG